MLGKMAAVVAGGWLSLVMLDGVPPYTGPYRLQDREHAEPIRSWRPLEPHRTLRILFIGNSFTFTHDIPAQVVNLASADPRGPVRLEVASSTIPGASLQQALERGEAMRILQSRSFDYVVLQDWSIWPFATDDTRAQTYDAVTRWAAAARRAGAQPVLYETWADKAGSDSYKPGWPYAGLTPDSAQAVITEASRRLATQAGLPLIGVGDPYVRLSEAANAPELYEADSHHPSPAGAFLAAAVLYHALTGATPATSGYHPPAVSEADRTAILSVASSSG